MKQLDKWIDYNRTRLSHYVSQGHIDKIKKDYLSNDTYSNKSSLKEFISFLFDDIDNSIEKASKFTLLLQEFRKELSYTTSDLEKERIILNYAQKLNPSSVELNKDSAALRRWFDEDALAERITSKRAYLHRHSIIALQRLESSIDLLTQEQKPTQSLWNYFDFNRRFFSILEYNEEPELRHKALVALIVAVKKFDLFKKPHLLDERFLQYIYTLSLSKKSSVWLVNDAIEFLAHTETSSFLIIAHKHASNHSNDDTIFIRHKIAKLLFQLINDPSHQDASSDILNIILELMLQDPSPYVRQGIVKELSYTTHPKLENLKEYFILKEPESSVRALAILQVLQTQSNTQRDKFKTIIHRSLLQEKNNFVLKTALFSIGKLAEASAQKGTPDFEFINQSINLLDKLIQSDVHVAMKRYASMKRELLWVCHDTPRYTLYKEFYHFVQSITPSKRKRLPKKFLDYDREDFYRIVCVVAQEDFSLEIQHYFGSFATLRRSEKMGKRTWRILYEFLHPSPDKREAFPHTIARIFEGTHQFPSSIMAEQAPTKVPGEPYFVPNEESSRPYLPLADHYLSSLKQPTLKFYPYRIYSSDGITTIEPPSSWWQRFKAQWRLTWNYAPIARLRNWQENFTEDSNAYVEEMKKLGFKTIFKPYVKGDKSTTQFFCIAPLPLLAIPIVSPAIQESISNYFISAYENSLPDLALFLFVLFAFFFIRHVRLTRKIRRAREGIALSIGGWGTRGKSGTERIKAALFNALGLRVFSKTTGNEAMFLHSESFEEMREMYLFRPYDKATIWEQADTVLIANALNVDVYLWESMGLTPSYVEVLQKKWMQDDIATITNTYPDHENLQGPAGINIPQVMTNFIPYNSTLITTEEVMYPILKAYSKSVNTPSLSTGWLQAGLIPPDILSRFPYEEHPYNIALVLMIASELDIDEDVALKAMADNIVPDLGVLKAFPPATVDTKELHFINGMSANERFGALGNWRRMKLDQRDDEKYPDSFLTTVINNRADRVSRSRVFASMIVEDVVADCHILIGSNLSGFMSYLDETWMVYKHTLSLKDDNVEPVDKLMEYAAKFRIIRTKALLKERLKVMLRGYAIEKIRQEEILEHYLDAQKLQKMLEEYPEIWTYYQEFYKQYKEFTVLKEKIVQSGANDANNNAMKQALWRWLKERVKPLYNYYATGNEVVQNIADHTPPGMFNTIIGMQNIKGTGLDFAYRWVAWDSCYQACQKITSSDTQEVREGVEALAAFAEHGPLTYQLTQESISLAKSSLATQTDYYQAQIQLIEGNLKKAQKEFEEKRQNSSDEMPTVSWVDKTLGMLEAFLDGGDAVKRRKRANLIYKDLINQRISHKQAAFELKKITKRQKGGWFTQKFKK